MKAQATRVFTSSTLIALLLAILQGIPSNSAWADSAVAPPAGIVAWWPGEGDAGALVGAPGTLGGGADFTAGEVSQAFQFSGGQFVATDLDVQPSALPSTTWEAWVYPTTAYVSSRQQILSSDSGGYGRSVLIESGTASFGVFTGAGVWRPVGVTTNQWQHIGVVFTPTNIWFYKDGAEFSYGQAPVERSSSQKLNIGRNPGYGEYFNGAIDEVTIYDRALGSNEVAAIYAAGSAGKLHTTAQAADLALAQTLNPQNISLGQPFTNEVVVSNLGPGTAPGVTLTFALPPNTTLLSSSSTAGRVYESGGNIYCLPGDLANGQTLTLDMVLSPTALGPVTNTASVMSLANDPSPANNSAIYVAQVYGHYTSIDGDWSATEVILTNTPEAELMVRVGDIDNLGFGWPANFSPFSGSSTPSHGFPWAVKTNDPPGTDRIMVVSSYDGHPPRGADGYTASTSRPGNEVQPITLNYSLGQRVVSSAALQIFVDDFQAPVWGAVYQVTLNGVRAPFLESVANSLVQTGPVGKLITAGLPADYLPLVQSGQLSLLFDDPTTGAGDGYAVDFVKLLINVKGFSQTGALQGTVVDADTQQPLAGAEVTAQGAPAATTDANGQYTLSNVAAGLVFVGASLPDYGAQVKSTDLVGGHTNQVNFALSIQPILRIEKAPDNKVLISWPGALNGFALQTAAPLTPAQWAPEGSSPALVNGRRVVTNSAGANPRFYRLSK